MSSSSASVVCFAASFAAALSAAGFFLVARLRGGFDLGERLAALFHRPEFFLRVAVILGRESALRRHRRLEDDKEHERDQQEINDGIDHAAPVYVDGVCEIDNAVRILPFHQNRDEFGKRFFPQQRSEQPIDKRL